MWFQVHTVPSMKMYLGNCALRSLVEVHRCLNMLIVLMIEASSTSETSAKFYYTTRHNIPEDSPNEINMWSWTELFCLKTGQKHQAVVEITRNFRISWKTKQLSEFCHQLFFFFEFFSSTHNTYICLLSTTIYFYYFLSMHIILTKKSKIK